MVFKYIWIWWFKNSMVFSSMFFSKLLCVPVDLSHMSYVSGVLPHWWFSKCPEFCSRSQPLRFLQPGQRVYHGLLGSNDDDFELKKHTGSWPRTFFLRIKLGFVWKRGVQMYIPMSICTFLRIFGLLHWTKPFSSWQQVHENMFCSGDGPRQWINLGSWKWW